MGGGGYRIFQDRARGTITKSRLEEDAAADGQFKNW